VPEPEESEATYSEEYRLISIKTTLGDTKLLLERFVGSEEMSRPFEFHVTMLSTEFEVDLKSLLRTSATVTISLYDETERKLNGKFRVLRQKGMSNQDLVIYEGVIVPSIWFLSLDSNCRIFQTMSVPDIVEQILKDNQISDYQFRSPLRDYSRYPKRDYCVQYRESSLNFISRLLEEEGIFYYFDHTDTKHTIVFGDNSPGLATCPGQPTALFSFSTSGWVKDKADSIIGFERIEEAYTGKVQLTDYNFETPTTNLKANVGSENEQDYDYPGNYLEVDEGSRYVGIRLDERELDQFVVRGVSRCRSFRPGYIFKLKDHFREDNNADYFITSVSHEILDTTYRAGDDPVADYRNNFTAIPKANRYRPPRRTRKPVVKGSQTALVVGKAGEEIWVDNYGRVKVQFYWDQIGTKNELSSCWVRVSQIWAGKNWGWITIPRIGQEVIVDFLEGDPDRPIITGRVYNADQTVPYTLPANQTQSGIKTRSSKGGTSDNYNELRFEDLKGSELFYMHAEKDMTTEVEHDDSQLVQNNRSIEVDGTHTEKIVKDTTITITQGNHSLTLNMGNQSITLDKGNQTTTITMGNQSTTLAKGNQTTVCSLGSISMEAMQSITLTVGPSSIAIEPSGITINAPMVTVNGDETVIVNGGELLVLNGAMTMIN
jgi:type VI secretion system secreted protein VgrG